MDFYPKLKDVISDVLKDVIPDVINKNQNFNVYRSTINIKTFFLFLAT